MIYIFIVNYSIKRCVRLYNYVQNIVLKGSSFQKANLGRCLYILQKILFHIQFAESLSRTTTRAAISTPKGQLVGGKVVRNLSVDCTTSAIQYSGAFL